MLIYQHTTSSNKNRLHALKFLINNKGRCNTILNKDISTYYDGAEIFNEDVIRPINNPLKPAAGLRVLRGNLAPNGAIIKPAAATESLLKHEGLAYVFEDIEDLKVFKTKAITIFAGIQFLMASAIAFSKFF